jgi:hypothetical protein
MRLQILVAAGAEKDGPTNFSNTPLAWAIGWNRPHVAEFLLHSGAKMVNVHPRVKIPPWMHQLVKKRENVMRYTLALKGVLRMRFRGRIPKDIVDLLGLYFWNLRLEFKKKDSLNKHRAVDL